MLSGVAMADSVKFYGGDFDGQNGLSDERGNPVNDAWVFDDFNWAGGTLTKVFGNYLSNVATITGMEFEIRSGVSAGNGGTLVASGGGSFTWGVTGAGGFGLAQYTGVLDVSDFNLAAGTYFLAVHPIFDDSGRAFLATTGGANSVGTPIANGNAFFRSTFFNSYYDTMPNILGNEADFSQGVYGLTMVPLPPAALAGGATLAGLAGFRAVRRRATKA